MQVCVLPAHWWMFYWLVILGVQHRQREKRFLSHVSAMVYGLLYPLRAGLLWSTSYHNRLGKSTKVFRRIRNKSTVARRACRQRWVINLYDCRSLLLLPSQMSNLFVLGDHSSHNSAACILDNGFLWQCQYDLWWCGLEWSLFSSIVVVWQIVFTVVGYLNGVDVSNLLCDTNDEIEEFMRKFGCEDLLTWKESKEAQAAENVFADLYRVNIRIFFMYD